MKMNEPIRMTRREFDEWWLEHGEYAEQVTGAGHQDYWRAVQPFFGMTLRQLFLIYPRIEARFRQWGLMPEVNHDPR